MKQLTFALTVLVMAAPVFAQESERKYLGRYSGASSGKCC